MTKLLAIVGPTASGKSELALTIASHLNGEILSADSRQVYRLLDIGTSKPTAEDQAKIPHHFVNLLDPVRDFNAGEFGIEARKRIADIIARGRQPILVGGSGLYVKAVIDGFFSGPGRDPEIRRQIEARLHKQGPGVLLEELSKIDPVSASLMEPSKPRRIVRALEVYSITGIPLSAFHKKQSTALSIENVQFGLEWDRARLYERIDARVDSMLARGLIEEVKNLHRQGYDHRLNALNTVGYKEVFDFLEGRSSYEEMVELMKRNTRRFAKRQLTWFRRDSRIKWITMDGSTSLERVADIVENDLRRVA